MDGLPKWYYELKNITLQKEAFFALLKPLVEKENQKILKERAFVKSFFEKLKTTPIPNQKDISYLAYLARKYRIKDFYNQEAYLKRIDTIPTALVLAQAALESGWGKSRFAKEANNFFGEWTFSKNGLIPKNRPEGKHHRIRIFKNIEDSIASYMLNLNRHRAYKAFRLARFEAKRAKKSFDGLEAAMTMQHYSELGRRYNLLVASIIKRHKLYRY